jgi:hypothetical protein
VTEPVRIPLDALRRHAGSADTLSDAMTVAHDAANQVYLDAGAYGQLCQFLPGLFDPVLSSTVEAMGAAAEEAEANARRLRRVADSAEATDIAAADRITAAGDGRIDLPL